MKIDELKKVINKIDKISNDEWVSKLEDRKLKELEFHNLDRDRKRIEEIDKDTFDKFYGNKKFYKTVQKSTNYTNEWIKTHAKNKIFLDYACGNGETALYAAKNGAKLSLGFDISDVSVSNCKEQAKIEKIKNAIFFQADCENTQLPDNSVDVIICSGMLHHLDLSYAFPELRRILAPGGKILAIEALDYNPFIKLYRYLTPSMRTEWEKAHILSYKDVRFAKNFFELGEIKHWHITSYAGAYFPRLLPLLNFIDSILVKVPIIKYMSWIFTFELLSNKKSI